ncbi:NDR1/HIN1-like protein 6 [Rutidosis leptorrhynchoides]|uniref:NDR1/HIN1-like protein 6 n=1 Tax=Rutidosis leptorrhynchoides TaxID=125765 RepID=UPI003A98D913
MNHKISDPTVKKIHPVADGNVKIAIPPPNLGQQLRPPSIPPPPPLPPPPPQTKNQKGFSWRKCVCWSLFILIILIIILAAIVGIIFLVFKPKVPNYSVDNLTITQLSLNPVDFSLYTQFNVRITAINPNKKIGIFYQKGSHLSVWYKNTNLCQGSIPKFYQGHQNKTVLNVALSGQNQYGRTLMAALQEQQQTGQIPLDLKINVPVKIELGKMKLMKVKVVGKCILIVDSLSTNSLISIKKTTCKFRVKL